MNQEKKKKLNQSFGKLKSAVKEKCLDCMNGQTRVDCEIANCPLYAYRPPGMRSKASSGKVVDGNYV